MNKPFVKMCMMCQSEFPEVGAAVQRASKQINFSHGVCIRHNIEVLKKRGKHSEEQLKQYASKLTGETPDLKQHPELVKAYSQGIFTSPSQQNLMEVDKPMVRICSWCQGINNKGMENFANTIPENVKKEMAMVDAQVKANQENFTFSHGTCLPHVVQSFKEMKIPEEKIKLMVDKVKGDAPPCLVEDTTESQSLRHAYMKGLFTKELIQQALEKQKGENDKITERLQVLAGIRKLHA